MMILGDLKQEIERDEKKQKELEKQQELKRQKELLKESIHKV